MAYDGKTLKCDYCGLEVKTDYRYTAGWKHVQRNDGSKEDYCPTCKLAAGRSRG